MARSETIMSTEGSDPQAMRLRRWRLLCLAAMLAVAALVSLLLADMPLARLASLRSLPKLLHKLFELSEVFSHGLGVLMILVAAAVLDPVRRLQLVPVAALAYGAGILANVVKTLIARARPSAAELSGSAWDTFQGWLPILWPADADPPWNRAMQSFPSGHTATAVGLAIGLTMLYPRGRWLFLGLACLAACQRIDSGAHYLSDTLASASLACLWAAACGNQRMLVRQLQRWRRVQPPPGLA